MCQLVWFKEEEEGRDDEAQIMGQWMYIFLIKNRQWGQIVHIFWDVWLSNSYDNIYIYFIQKEKKKNYDSNVSP